MASSRAQNYHICDKIYNLYEGNVFEKKIEIKFIPITALYVVQDKTRLNCCIWIIVDAVKPYHILILKKNLDQERLKNVCHDIDAQCLITLLEYQHIKEEKNTNHKSNYMGI